MSTNLKVVEGRGDDAPEVPSFTEELPPLQVDPTSFSARMAGVEDCSVIREITKHWASSIAFEVERAQERGEAKTYKDEQRFVREAWQRKFEAKPDDALEEHIEYIKNKATRYIDWGDLGTLWNASPHDAINLWRMLRLEARDEFVSGHYGARPFDSTDIMERAFSRAQYLSVRDGLVEEWKPRGASEYILIDQMTQAYVMQLLWTEKALTRARGEPRVESYEFRQWQERRAAAAKANQWTTGEWDIPYQHEAAAVEQAFRLVDLCAKSFQRAARQLANIRLVRAKTAQVKRRERAKLVKAVAVTCTPAQHA